MKQSILLIWLAVFLFSACKEKPVQTDNLYKYKKYISHHTHGLQSIAEPIKIGLAQPLAQYELNQELPADYLQITPDVKGQLILQEGTELVFVPKGRLKSDTEYSITVALNKLIPDIERDFETYTFAFKTIPLNFKIDLGSLQSYSREWQYLNGAIEASDIIEGAKIPSLIQATQGGQKLKVVWENIKEDGGYFSFKIDSIQRGAEDEQIQVSWNGKGINVDNEGEEIFTIPGLNNFVVVRSETSAAPNPSLTLNFSEPLDANQNFEGLVQLGDLQNLRYEVQGNILKVYPTTSASGEIDLTVFEGIKSQYGYALKKPYRGKVVFEQINPEVRIISSGTILPNSLSTPLYFETVSLAAVEVRVIEIYKDNVLQYLQNNELDMDYMADLRPVGKKVAYKIIDLTKNQQNLSLWTAHALDLSQLISTSPGAIYRVEFSFKKEHAAYTCPGETPKDSYEIKTVQDPEEQSREERYWDNEIYQYRYYEYNWREQDNPCHEAYYHEDRIAFTNLLGSDLGLIVKKGKNGKMQFVATNLVTAVPEADVQIKLYDFQKQLIETVTTDMKGMATVQVSKKPAFVVGHKSGSYTYLKIDDAHALSMSKFDVSGQSIQEGIQGFLYTERGVHRPGERVHLTFVKNDIANPLPANHPVTMEVTNARGTLVHRATLPSQESGIEQPSRAENNFYYFPFDTKEEDPTGTWNATVHVGGASFSKNIKIATVKPNRLKINIGFEEEVLLANAIPKGNLSAAWLHGAPARNLKAKVEVDLQSSNTRFQGYDGYLFKDPVRTFSERKETYFEGTLDENGLAYLGKEFKVQSSAPGMLEASFTTQVFEEGGGYSLDVFKKKIAPYTTFIGIKSPEPQQYGSYSTEENNEFDIVALDYKGKPQAGKKLQVEVFRIEWRWWWNRGRDNLSSYENTTIHKAYMNKTITTDSRGKASFVVNIPNEDGGRFLIRVKDGNKGHATGRTAYFYRDWWKRPSGGDTESSKVLIFNSDKETYKVGEKAQITFPSELGSKALMTIENGVEVLATKWVDGQKGQTTTEVVIGPEMAPNVYINISLIQPHKQTINDMPMRLYGVVPLMVDNPETQLRPIISMKEELRPESSYTIKVSEEENKPMTYTLAVVDEGLLDLTRFQTPAIHEAFYSRQSLGVRTFDVFDEVIGALTNSVDNIYAIGGGEEGAGAKNKKAQRFKPVVSFLGPFNLKPGETQTHTLEMPNYIGAVRTMVVAGNAYGAYGNAEQSSTVKKPLMLLTSIPRQLSPKDKITIPVTIFAMDKKVKNVKVKVDCGTNLRPLGSTNREIVFDQIGEQMVNFEFEVVGTSLLENIKVTATGAGETATESVEISIANPNPITTESSTIKLLAGEQKNINPEFFGTEGTNELEVVFSTLPPMDLSGRLAYLISYPHGCIEQTTSSAFPQLFLEDILELDENKKSKAQENIKAALKRLSSFQLPSGGLGYWPGSSMVNDWGTNYAGHFAIEARKKGFALPLTFMSNWIKYQKNAARQWSEGQYEYRTQLVQAYRLYTLALAGQPELAAMNRLRTHQKLDVEAKWRLAAAYAVLGKKDAARAIIANADVVMEEHSWNRYSYGSRFRNQAMLLESLVEMGDNRQRVEAVAIANRLSSDSWLSTQETAYALLALSKMVEKNGGKGLDLTYTYRGDSGTIKTEKSLASVVFVPKTGTSLQVVNKGQADFFITTTVKGRLPLGEERAISQGLTLKVNYYDSTGKPISISQLRQGTEITAKLTVYNDTNENLTDVALTHIIPSGWELLNTSFADNNNLATADYTDIRDERTSWYFDLPAKKSITFSTQINASFMGTYYLPGAQVEAMYDGEKIARNKGEVVQVVQ